MIVLVTRFSWQRSTPGGGEMSALLHARILKKLGNEVTYSTNIKKHKKEALYLPLPGQRHLQQIVAIFLLPVLLARRADLYNPHSRVDQIFFSLLKFLHGKPVVWKDAGDLTHQIELKRTNPYQILNQKLLLKAIDRADAIYTLNKDELEDIKHKLGILAPNINVKKFSIVESDILFTDYNLDEKPIKKTKKLVIGALGRIEFSSKGFDILAKSLPFLKNDFELWVVGDGPDIKRFKEWTSEFNVHYYGYDDDVSKFLSGMDVFVQPSRFEGFGRTVKEAMYFGIPVVGSSVGGIKKQIHNNKNGLLFKVGDARELAKNIDRLLSDNKLRNKLGKQAHNDVLERGDMVNTIENKVLPIFRKALDENST